MRDGIWDVHICVCIDIYIEAEQVSEHMRLSRYPRCDARATRFDAVMVLSRLDVVEKIALMMAVNLTGDYCFFFSLLWIMTARCRLESQ